MIKQLWKVIDKLETIAIPGFFDDSYKQTELLKAIANLKQIIKEIEND